MGRLDVFISGKYGQNDRNAIERWSTKRYNKGGTGWRTSLYHCTLLTMKKWRAVSRGTFSYEKNSPMIKTVCISLVCLFCYSYVYKPFAATMESKSLSSSCSLKKSRQSIKNKNSKKTDDKGIVPVLSSTLHLHEKHYLFLSSSSNSTNWFLCSTISTNCFVFCCTILLSCFDGSETKKQIGSNHYTFIQLAQ